MLRYRPAALLPVIALAIGSLSCREGTTGVCVVVDDPGAADHLLISVVGPGDNLLYGPKSLPDPARPLKRAEDFCLYVDDKMDRQEVSCRAKGQTNGVVMAAGGTTVTLRKGTIVDCNVTLAPSTIASDTVGCADGTREGFLDSDAFTDIAACADETGTASSYQKAKPHAEAFCQAGWHWCTPDDIAKLPNTPIPTAVPRPADDGCAWARFETSMCMPGRLFTASDCTGLVFDGNMEGTGPCRFPQAGVPTCDYGWRAGVTFTAGSWPGNSLSVDRVCYPHVGALCATDPSVTPDPLLGPRNCWVSCCKDR
jgi:hypothetical protein